MTQLISAGGATFVSQPFFTESPVVIKALGLGTGKLTLQIVTVIDKTTPNGGTICKPIADTSSLLVTSSLDYPCFKLCAASPVGAVPIGGWYTVLLSADSSLSTADVSYQYVSIEQANAVPKCNGCEAPVAPPVPVTGTVTGLPCPLPASFMWNGAATTLSQFITDVKAQVAGAVYNAAQCKFTAPEGSTFPPLTVSAIVVVPPAPPNTGVLSCVPNYPVLFQGVRYGNIFALKAAIESFYSIVTVYDSATQTFTKCSGCGVMPASIAIECGCGFYLSGGSVSINAGTAQFRKVQIDPALLPLTGFYEFNDNGSNLVSLLRLTSGTQCGITFNVAVSDNSGSIVGYGAQI